MKGRYGKLVFYLEVHAKLDRLANQAQCSRSYQLIPKSMGFLLLVHPNHPGELIAVLTTSYKANTSDLALEISSVLISLKTSIMETTTKLFNLNSKSLRDWPVRVMWCNGGICLSNQTPSENTSLIRHQRPTILDSSNQLEDQLPLMILPRWTVEPWGFNPSLLSTQELALLKPSRKWLRKSTPWRDSTLSLKSLMHLYSSILSMRLRTSISSAWNQLLMAMKLDVGSFRTMAWNLSETLPMPANCTALLNSFFLRLNADRLAPIKHKFFICIMNIKYESHSGFLVGLTLFFGFTKLRKRDMSLM